MNYHSFVEDGHLCPKCGAGPFLCSMEDGQCDNNGICDVCVYEANKKKNYECCEVCFP